MSEQRFRMGSLDHVHLRVPDRAAAAEWYAAPCGGIDRFSPPPGAHPLDPARGRSEGGR